MRALSRYSFGIDKHYLRDVNPRNIEHMLKSAVPTTISSPAPLTSTLICLAEKRSPASYFQYTEQFLEKMDHREPSFQKDAEDQYDDIVTQDWCQDRVESFKKQQIHQMSLA